MAKKHPEKISVNIRGRLSERLEKLASLTGLRTSDILRNALDEYLDKRNL